MRSESCGTQTKMTTLERMMTGVDQRVVSKPWLSSVAEYEVSVIKNVEAHEMVKMIRMVCERVGCARARVDWSGEARHVALEARAKGQHGLESCVYAP